MLTRRKMISLIGGGVVLCATSSVGYIASRKPKSALLPWEEAGEYTDARKRALSYALLAPNPHNRQPWIADLQTPNAVTLYADTEKMLPHTDPFNRQITVGLGCFLELLGMAAVNDGYEIKVELFPEGQNEILLDKRPIAHITFIENSSLSPDELFSYALQRRTNKEPYDLAKKVDPAAFNRILLAVNNGNTAGGVIPPFLVVFETGTHAAIFVV